MVEGGRRQPGWPQVVLVSVAVVAVVLGAELLTGLLPEDLRRTIRDAPIAIAVLILGTAFVLWHISRGRPSA